MVEEDEYRTTYHTLNDRRCVFEKTILSHRSGCSQSSRFFLADREGIRCNSPEYKQHCAAFLPHLRQKARFALGLHETSDTLPYTQEIRIQTGGMLGLQRIANHDDTEPDHADDISTLICDGLKKYADINNFPFQDIIQSIAKFKGRKKRQHR